MSFMIYLRCFNGIVLREALRFVHQKERFFSALVRPLVWLGIFAAGFRSVLGVSIIPPYETYIPYEVYIAPGLIAMIQLFNGMQSSLSMVYDREMGSMKTMLVSPIPRWFLLVSKLLAGVFVSILQVYAFLIIASLWDIIPPVSGYMDYCFSMYLYIFTYVRCSRFTSFCLYQAIRKLCGNYEFCNFSNVFCFICIVSIVEN